MKSLISAIIVVFCLIAATYAKPPEDFLAKINEYKADCIKESGVDAKFVEEMEKVQKELQTPTPEQMKLFDSKAGKCFAKCISVKMGIVTEKGDIQYDNISKQFDIPIDSDGMKQIKLCADSIKQDDLCERLAGIKTCIMTELKIKQ